MFQIFVLFCFVFFSFIFFYVLEVTTQLIQVCVLRRSSLLRRAMLPFFARSDEIFTRPSFTFCMNKHVVQRSLGRAAVARVPSNTHTRFSSHFSMILGKKSLPCTLLWEDQFCACHRRKTWGRTFSSVGRNMLCLTTHASKPWAERMVRESATSRFRLEL